jgi:hypothetical protein
MSTHSTNSFIPRLSTLPDGWHPSKDIIWVIGKLHAAGLVNELMVIPDGLAADFGTLEATGYRAEPGAVAAILLVIGRRFQEGGWVETDDTDPGAVCANRTTH